MENSVLTGGLTYKDRNGTLIDWNLCFNAQGRSSNRTFRSGTLAFMALALLADDKITRRTLGHDMESFFSVMIWIASLDLINEATFLDKPLAMMLDKNKDRKDIANAKRLWFERSNVFKDLIIDHFEPQYRKDLRFVICLFKLREILYPDETYDLNALLSDFVGGKDKVTEDADPMKEGLFRECTKEMDDYLHETKGCDEMRWIDSQAVARDTPESLVEEGNRGD